MPTIQSLTKPSSVGGAVVETDSEIRYTTGGILRMKISSISLQAKNTVIDATGEADNVVVFKNAKRLSGGVRIVGNLITGAVLGFANILGDEETRINAVLGHAGGLSGFHTLQFNMIITGVSLDYNRQAPTIPVVIEGNITGEIDTGVSIREATEGIATQT